MAGDLEQKIGLSLDELVKLNRNENRKPQGERTGAGNKPGRKRFRKQQQGSDTTRIMQQKGQTKVKGLGQKPERNGFSLGKQSTPRGQQGNLKRRAQATQHNRQNPVLKKRSGTNGQENMKGPIQPSNMKVTIINEQNKKPFPRKQAGRQVIKPTAGGISTPSSGTPVRTGLKARSTPDRQGAARGRAIARTAQSRTNAVNKRRGLFRPT